MIDAIFSGIGFGLVLTFITGPVFFALIKTSIERGFHAGVALALGIVASDAVFVGAILFGSQLVDITPQTKTNVGIVGCAILLAVGVYYLFKKSDVNYNNTTPSKLKRTGYFFKGFLMCIFNPTILFHWITIIGFASTIYHEGVNDHHLKIGVMFLTILIVQFGLDTIKAFYANKLRQRLSVNFVHKLNIIAGWALIIASVVLFDRLVTHYVFSAPAGA
ncbi:MAG: LysE family translocator [Sphingobacteriaceae bacterium]|nr:MAG: LysE family translocator [Sphingobacteriaceae bacterium]